MAELPPVLYSILAHSETFLNTFCKNQAKQLQQLRALTEVVAVKKIGSLLLEDSRCARDQCPLRAHNIQFIF